MSSIVQIKDSAYDGLQSLRVHGATRQNLWVNPSGTINGVTVTSNEDGSLSVSGTVNSLGAYIKGEKLYVLRPNTKYTFSVDKTPDFQGFFVNYYASSDEQIGNSVYFTSTYSVTTPSDLAYVKFCVGFNKDQAGTTVSGTYRVMLNEGSTAEPWCPPGLNSVGDDGSVDIVTAGKNLLAKSEFNSIGWSYDSRDTVDTLNALPVGTYKLSGIFELISSTLDSSRYGYVVMTLQGTIINASGSTWDSTVAGTVKTRADTLEITDAMRGDFTHFYIYGCGKEGVGTTGSANVKLQLELGSTATDYEPPSITTTPIDLQGHTLNALPDGTRDELHIDGGGNVVLEKRVQRVQLDGDSNWSRFEAPFIVYTAPWQNFGGSPAGTTGSAYVDKLPPTKKVRNGLYSASANGIEAYFRDPVFASDAAGVKTWMGANKPVAIMPLLEPHTIDLGTIELPKLRKKPLVNTIWANGTAEGTGFSLAPEIDCEYNRWSTYCDGFKTHGKHSYFDMGCCLAARDTGTPEKKNITATVPYMSGFYDFSKLYGAIAFEARQLTYRFEFVEDSREELQQKKSQFLEWLSQVHDEEIADDDIPGRHFIGSLSEWEFEEGEEGQSGSLEVTFNCQPFLEADEDTTKTCSAGSNTVTVEGQPVNAYAKTSSGTATIQIGGVTQSVGTTEIRLSVQLQPGDNAVTVTGSAVTLRWRELTA